MFFLFHFSFYVNHINLILILSVYLFRYLIDRNQINNIKFEIINTPGLKGNSTSIEKTCSKIYSELSSMKTVDFNIAVIVAKYSDYPTEAEIDCYTSLFRDGHSGLPIMVAIVGASDFSNAGKTKAKEQVQDMYASLDISHVMHLDLSPIRKPIQTHGKSLDISNQFLKKISQNYKQKFTIKKVDEDAKHKEISEKFPHYYDSSCGIDTFPYWKCIKYYKSKYFYF